MLITTGFEVTSVLARHRSVPRRRTVNTSSRPSRRLFAAPGWALSSSPARCLVFLSPSSGSGWLKGLTSFASTRAFSLSGGAVPKPDREPAAVGGDRQVDEDAAAGHVLPIEHQDLDLVLGQVPSVQLREGGLGLLHEPARDHRPARAARAVQDCRADGLGDPGVPAGRDPGEHPLEHDLTEQIVGGELRVGLQWHLVAVQSPGSWPSDLDPPAAEGHRAVLAAVKHRDALRVVLALRAGHRGDLSASTLPAPRLGLLSRSSPAALPLPQRRYQQARG